MRALGLGGREVHDELLPWFSRKLANSSGATDIREFAPYAGDLDLPYYHGFAGLVCWHQPTPDPVSAATWFDGLPYTLVTVQSLRRLPEFGYLSPEHPEWRPPAKIRLIHGRAGGVSHARERGGG